MLGSVIILCKSKFVNEGKTPGGSEENKRAGLRALFKPCRFLISIGRKLSVGA